jgi:hypothetical protein
MGQLKPEAIRRFDKVREYLRLFLMDTPELNRLLRTYEIDNKRLDLAIMLTISDWNSTTPRMYPVNIGNFPSFYLLLHGATIQCLKMAGLYQSRNEMTYQTGGSSFVRSNKTQYYQSWIQNLSQDYEIKKLNFKIQQNCATAFGGFHSEYELIGWDF